MAGLMNAGGDSKKGKFLGYQEAIVDKGSQRYDSNSKFFHNSTFLKKCKVRIIAHTYSDAGTGMGGINVTLSGVGSIIDAYSTGHLKTLNNVYSVSEGQTLTANASAPYKGAAGYVVFLEE